MNMHNETENLLSDLLKKWHRWASGYQVVSRDRACAMFTGALSSRQWDSTDEILDSKQHRTAMETVDFCVMELEPIHRTAIQIQARNLSLGVNVWRSDRLPADPVARTYILIEARGALMGRLIKAGGAL